MLLSKYRALKRAAIMQTIRAVIIDDERLARKYLKQLLAAHPSIDIVGEAENVTVAARLCEQTKPDLVFLDVQMAESDGFSLLSRLAPGTLPKVIFVTAYSEYAARAFDVQAVDYLLKPVSPQRMLQALQRAQALPGEADQLTLDDSICLRDGTRVVVSPLREIIAIQAEADYSRVHFTRHPQLMVHRRMHEWEALLPSKIFARLDRSLLINTTFISRLERQSRDVGLLYLNGLTDAISIGRVASSRAKALLNID
jgi:two-component system, LytTR family, response regulator